MNGPDNRNHPFTYPGNQLGNSGMQPGHAGGPPRHAGFPADSRLRAEDHGRAHASGDVRWQQEPSMVHAVQPDDWGSSRDARAFRHANRHSGLVRRLRVILPVMGILIIAGLLGAYLFSQAGLPDAVVEQASFDKGRLVMKNPKLDGVDRDQRPYRLTAREAIQDPSKPKQVELQAIHANVPLPEGLFADINAGNGFYNGDAKTLNLGGEVDVRTDDGMTARLTDADIDMDAGTLRTANPVQFNSEQATISAGSMTVEENGARVVFETRVRMTIYPDKVRELQEREASAEEQAAKNSGTSN